MALIRDCQIIIIDITLSWLAIFFIPSSIIHRIISYQICIFFRYFHLPWLDVKATSTPDTPVPRKTRHSLAQTQILSKSCLSVLLQSNQDSLFLHSPPFLPPQNKQLISIECLRSLVRFFYKYMNGHAFLDTVYFEDLHRSISHAYRIESLIGTNGL